MTHMVAMSASTVKRLITDKFEQCAYLTVQQAAALLGLCDQTVRRRMKSGEIPYRKIGASWRIKRTELDAYIERKTPTGDNREGQYNIGGSK